MSDKDWMRYGAHRVSVRVIRFWTETVFNVKNMLALAWYHKLANPTTYACDVINECSITWMTETRRSSPMPQSMCLAGNVRKLLSCKTKIEL